MRTHTPTLLTVLHGSFDVYYECDVFVEGERVLQNVPIQNVTLNDDSTALVQGSGSFTVVYTDDFGKSIAPNRPGDVFAPYGTQVKLYVTVKASPAFTERILMGTYLVSETPTIFTQWAVFNGGVLSHGDLIDVTILDLMSRTQANTFDTPGSPASLASVYTEVQHLTQLPLTRTLPDTTIPTSIAYQTDRLQAVYDLATVLDGTACMTPDGTVSMRPNIWPAVVDTLNGGDGGTLIGAPRAMQNTGVYNKIVVKDVSGNILATGQVPSGPLRAANADGSLSPFGTRTFYYSSPFVVTAAQAQNYIINNLPRVSALRAMKVKAVEVFNPLRELGDVITVNRISSGVIVASFTGRVTRIDRSPGRTQNLELAVNQ